MTNIPGLKKLWTETRGDPKICVAVLDGIVDQNHPCFDGADLTRLPSLVSGEANENGSMSTHGTHVASIIFGQPDSPVEGIAPHCRGLIVPVFADDRLRLSQLDLARAIEQAVNAGANIINISAGQLTDEGEADTWLEKSVQLCKENNVLLIAATGNDGCECLHVPASLPTVLAVGAMDDQGKPTNFSNWGGEYQNQGILAPGENILGAKPGGGTTRLNGTSFATPIVSGVVALLLSLQIKRGEKPDPQKVRTALLATATPCNPKDTDEQNRCLMGKLNIPDAIEFLLGETMSDELDLETVEASGCGCGDNPDESVLNEPLETSELKLAEVTPSQTEIVSVPPSVSPVISQPNPVNTMSNSTNFVTASEAPSELEGKNLVYALGVLGYDFGSEARRDSFKQLMPGVSVEGTLIPANPYDARQMVDYLGENLPEAKALIWTLNLELTPIYAIEPVGGFSRDVYEVLQSLLDGQIQAETDPNFVQRVSIPGVLTGRSVKLFSGQVVPVVEINNTRGLYGWKVNTLVTAAIASVQEQSNDAEEDAIRRTLSSFLNRIYYDLRNLGTTSQDRALNFASTNAFQAASTFAQAVGAGYELDSINVEKSPFCRLDSDCWDVKLKFFDPENSRRAKKIYRFTIDVSDTIPVTLGEVRSWSSAY
ncbi:MAG: PatA/PatG family cyanobactin maturation protease [Woronichinia naegeliana WA131]|uniref:PatA/PatG family cyanobactin maturation protease n=1 Tax=Woronichinia naegeliana WA131 TaxID=2824559 RepID=A0A977KTI7_9CYAN|nr:MAG: PatA/PatG family cyanobactin maturation protease [Woronichinia naegeliana WA131]